MAEKLVQGVGLNDAGYQTAGCPIYRVWRDMLARGYSEKEKSRNPGYRDVSVCDEWLKFSTFREWMLSQDYHGKQLDKDLLQKGNKVYGPDTSLFIDKRVNLFITESASSRGEYPIGVRLHKSGKYEARCGSTCGQKYLGLHETPEEAHQAWLSAKLEQAKILASGQTDPRVAKALIERYENYGSDV